MSFDRPEKRDVKLGIIPLTDCAPIAVAKEQGFFESYGLRVTLSREPSWANIRDKIMVGALDGAQMLAPMPIAATLGLGTPVFPMVAGISLGLNGNAITISTALFEEIAAADPTAATSRPMSARGLRAVISKRERDGNPPLVFAMVYPFSMHNYMLRYWLAAAGIHPDKDVHLLVIPPPQMASELASGAIDGFCSGSPWNQLAVAHGTGRIAITGYELWNNAPEKVLGVSQNWACENPNTHIALIRALLEAAHWLDDKAHLSDAAQILSRDAYVGVSAEIIERSLVGNYRYGTDTAAVEMPDFHVFHRYSANFPWPSHAVWLLSQMYRWGQLTTPCDLMGVARSVYRPDIFRRAAVPLNTPVPDVDIKTEGMHADVWTLGEKRLGPDLFVDGRRFDPARAVSYLEGFDVHSLRLPLNQVNMDATSAVLQK